MNQETAISRMRSAAIGMGFVAMFVATISCVIYAMSSGAGA